MVISVGDKRPICFMDGKENTTPIQFKYTYTGMHAFLHMHIYMHRYIGICMCKYILYMCVCM